MYKSKFNIKYDISNKVHYICFKLWNKIKYICFDVLIHKLNSLTTDKDHSCSIWLFESVILNIKWNRIFHENILFLSNFYTIHILLTKWTIKEFKNIFIYQNYYFLTEIEYDLHLPVI